MTGLTHLAAGQIVGGDYRVVELLTEGGMGAVYVVEQSATGKRRALKMMQPQLAEDPKFVERFVQEAKIASKVESEHLVDVVDAGVDDKTGAPFLVMELLKGETLAKRLQREGAMSPATTLDLFRQVAHGLGQLHAMGVVHRDLKPDNIFLVSASDADFLVKILDFGIAKVLAEANTGATAALGTPLYMPPEQMTPGASVTPASDVWALGLIAFRCLSGRAFWLGARGGEGSAPMIVNEVVNLPIPPASARAAELGAPPLPAGFDEWFAIAVNRSQRARFSDAKTTYEALRAALTGKATSTTPLPSTGEPTPPRYELEAYMPTALASAATVPKPPTAPTGPTGPTGPTRAPGWGALKLIPLVLLGFVVAGASVAALIVYLATRHARTETQAKDRGDRTRIEAERDDARKKVAEMEVRAAAAEERVRMLENRVEVEKDAQKKAELQAELDKARSELKDARSARTVPPVAPPSASVQPCKCDPSDPLCDCY